MSQKIPVQRLRAVQIFLNKIIFSKLARRQFLIILDLETVEALHCITDQLLISRTAQRIKLSVFGHKLFIQFKAFFRIGMRNDLSLLVFTGR